MNSSHHPQHSFDDYEVQLNSLRQYLFDDDDVLLDNPPQNMFDDDEILLENFLKTPPHISLDECLADPTIGDNVFNFDHEDNGLPEQIINQPEPDHYKVHPTTNNIPSDPPMAANADIPPTIHNSIAASIPCNDPRTTHTGAPILGFDPHSSYTITPTTHNNDPLLCYHPSSCAVPTTETKTNYDTSYIDPFIETRSLASHITPTNTQLCMTTHKVHSLPNSQPPPPSGLPMAPIYVTNQLNQVISPPRTYPSYSLGPTVRQMAMNLPSCQAINPLTLNLCSFNDTTSAFCGLHYNEGTCAGFGSFPDAGMTVRQSEAVEPCNLGIYSFAPMQSVYHPRDSQVLRDCNQRMSGCSTSTAPLKVVANDFSTSKESGLKVPKLTLEERKKKISRHKEKRNTRNFSKKITYDCRKKQADSRHRVRGRFARNEEVPQAALRPPRSADH
ncbi:uncharacterized protein LOC110020487 [Phalaenopsis equestris]|uniref:uncharacterized protein LOC110020487 n=1 Tax=Phalaenopsis equestris TaxID=78828 RepID=UPI0009E5AF71|nr:uncharacterized protein LOC110020487 [Phalaenopsis equestris]